MPEASVTSVETLPKAVVVRVLAGNLGSKEVNGVCAAVDAARKTAPSLPYILDMSKVSYVPSVGLGVLVGLNQEFKTRSQRLIFAGLQPNVRQSFTVTHISRMIEIIADLPAALKSLESGT